MPDAVILAGGRIPQDFADAVGTDLKGLIEVRGCPAVYYVLEALRAAKSIGRVALVGPREYADEVGDRLDAYVPEGPDIGANLRLAVEALGLDDGGLFVITCDAVCTQGADIDEFLSMCPRDADIVCPIVSLEAVEAEFPRRRWIRVPLHGQKVVVTNMFLVRPRVLLENEEMVATIAATRKSVAGMARLWGLGFLVKLFLHRLTLQAIVERVHSVTGVRGAAVMFPRAQVAMDLDFAVDVGIVEHWFARRQARR